MNQTNLVIGGIVVVAVLTGLFFYSTSNPTTPNTTTTSTPQTAQTPLPNTTTPVSDAGVPSVVTNNVAQPTNTTAVVTGSVIPNGNTTLYWFEYGQSTTLGIKTASQTVGSGLVSIPAPAYITGLTKNTTYYYRIVAENDFGKVAGSQYSFQTTTNTPLPVGSTPSVRTIGTNNVGTSTVTLKGEVTPNKAATSYWFEYGTSDSFGQSTTLVAVGDGSTSLTATQFISGLKQGTTYAYRINAQNKFGTVNGTTLFVRTAGPTAAAAPSITGVSATSVGTGDATIKAHIDPNGVETIYWIEYSTDSLLKPASLNTTTEQTVGGGTSSIAITKNLTGLASSTPYYFRVAARNANGTTKSARALFTTKK